MKACCYIRSLMFRHLEPVNLFYLHDYSFMLPTLLNWFPCKRTIVESVKMLSL